MAPEAPGMDKKVKQAAVNKDLKESINFREKSRIV